MHTKEQERAHAATKTNVSRDQDNPCNNSDMHTKEQERAHAATKTTVSRDQDNPVQQLRHAHEGTGRRTCSDEDNRKQKPRQPHAAIQTCTRRITRTTCITRLQILNGRNEQSIAQRNEQRQAHCWSSYSMPTG